MEKAIQGFQNSNFTSEADNATINLSDLIGEEEEMLARYHFENTIYLYGVMEKDTAYNAISENSYNKTLVLYETPKTAINASKGNNYTKPVIARFAVDISYKKIVYDELIAENEDAIKKSKLSQEEYISKAEYTRRYDSKNKRIYYEIRNIKRVVNMQII